MGRYTTITSNILTVKQRFNKALKGMIEYDRRRMSFHYNYFHQTGFVPIEEEYFVNMAGILIKDKDYEIDIKTNTGNGKVNVVITLD